jgi:aspartokinase/homoserine dehydrogenase 1
VKVLKFGGTSLGSAENILKVKAIIERQTEPVIVVASALGGVTDQLLLTARLACNGDENYEKVFETLAARHRETAQNAVSNSARREKLAGEIAALLDELANFLRGVYWVGDLSQRTSDVIVSYGERMSSRILAAALDDACFFDSDELIKTEKQFEKHIVNLAVSNELIKNCFARKPRLSVVAGFIARDLKNGDITNLGRGGSDYTASIIAAALDASRLEIWTDVDGFMTADPRIISSAYVIPEMSYVEAMELSNFGAKVIYPPTIYPAYHKNIPILIKNTFNPESKGTYISKTDSITAKHIDSITSKHIDSITASDTINVGRRQLIRGISSIGDTCLITMQGLGMVGVLGINQRIFKSLSNAGVSVFMVAQASSENTTSFAVRDDVADTAVAALNEEFRLELSQGEINDVKAEKGLATVAVVGENMKHVPGIAGKLFETLSRGGISIKAITQGASETNISFVIESRYLRKALNSIHDSFFLSEYQVLNIFLTGVGTVGGKLLQQIRQQQKTLMEHNGLKLNVVGIANASRMLLDRAGIDIDSYKKELQTRGEASSPQKLRDEIIAMNIFNSVFVDCTASADIAALYEDFLEHNISVVAANKIAASSDYASYLQLKETARAKGVKFLFETNVGAGLPIINTMNALINSGDKILRLQAVLSGTLNFIFNALSEEITMSRAIRMALDAGFAEPDPRVDLSGVDVVRKLVILSREAGYAVEQEDVERQLFIPDKFFKGSLNDFWDTISQLDNEFEEKRKQLAAQGKRLRFVAEMDNGRCSVGLQEVGASHPFYELEGSNNIIMLTTERYNEFPMIIKGYGAGAAVTAAGVFADIISIVNIR